MEGLALLASLASPLYEHRSIMGMACCCVPCWCLVVSQQAPGGIPTGSLSVHIHACSTLSPRNGLQLLLAYLWQQNIPMRLSYALSQFAPNI